VVRIFLNVEKMPEHLKAWLLGTHGRQILGRIKASPAADKLDGAVGGPGAIEKFRVRKITGSDEGGACPIGISFGGDRQPLGLRFLDEGCGMLHIEKAAAV